jgi:hypothetical protein
MRLSKSTSPVIALCLALSCGALAAAADAVRTAGDLQTVIERAPPGSRVALPSGAYPGGLVVRKSLTVDLAGVELRGIARQRAVISVVCDNCTVVLENFAINGRKSGCIFGNCAGIKVEGIDFDLTLRNGHIDNTVIGILTDNRGGRLRIDTTRIENTARNDRSTALGHGIYAGIIDELIVTRSQVRAAHGNGHLIKSRAGLTVISESTIAGLDGRHSRTIDVPCGGNLAVLQSVLQHGEHSDNHDLVSMGTEPGNCPSGIPPSHVVLRDNWILFERDRSPDERGQNRGPNTLFTWYAPVAEAVFERNRLVEPTGDLRVDPLPADVLSCCGNRLFANRAAAGLDADALPAIALDGKAGTPE